MNSHASNDAHDVGIAGLAKATILEIPSPRQCSAGVGPSRAAADWTDNPQRAKLLLDILLAPGTHEWSCYDARDHILPIARDLQKWLD